MNTIINILNVAFVLALFFLSLAIKCKGDVYKMALDLIRIAENLDTSGENKMGYVVDEIYKHLPVAVRDFVGVEAIRNIAQHTFDKMKEYYKVKAEKRSK